MNKQSPEFKQIRFSLSLRVAAYYNVLLDHCRNVSEYADSFLRELLESKEKGMKIINEVKLFFNPDSLTPRMLEGIYEFIYSTEDYIEEAQELIVNGDAQSFLTETIKELFGEFLYNKEKQLYKYY